MKLVIFLSRLATLGVVATAAGLAFNALALALFAAAASAFVLLIASGDYAPRHYAGAKRPVARREAMPLAA